MGRRKKLAARAADAALIDQLDPGASSWQSRRKTLAVCGLLCLAVVVVFGQTLRFGFVDYDDPGYTYQNPTVLMGLTGPGIAWAFTHVEMANWHPLTCLSHSVDFQLFGMWAGGHHLTSVALHAANAMLLFLALRQLTGAFWSSALAASLFAAHPLRAESVAWISERKDVLSGFFFLLTLIAYARYARLPFSLPLYLTVLALFACGLMAKPMLVTLPCLLLLLDWWPLGRLTARASDGQPAGSTAAPASERSRLAGCLWEKVPFFALSAADSAITLVSQREVLSSGADLSIPTRIANALVAYATYLFQTFVPIDLAAFYPYPGNGLPAWKIATSAAVLLAISILALLARRKFPYLLVGWLWFLGLLTPVIGIVQVGMQAWADRYTYLPQIGLCIALAWGLTDLARSWSARCAVRAIVVALLLAALMTCAARQASTWRDSETLWKHALASTSDNWLAHNNLGAALYEQNKTAEAIAHYEAVLQQHPTEAMSRINLGKALVEQGRIAEGMAHFDRVLQDQPTGDVAAKLYANIGAALERQGKFAEALEQYEKSLKIFPNDALVHYDLGSALDKQGRLAEAAIEYERALELSPNASIAGNSHANLGAVLERQGKLAEAMSHYARATELQPDNATAANNLGVALERQGQTAEALLCYRQAIRAQPDFALAHCNLANLLARGRRFGDAIPEYEIALRIEPGMQTAQINLCDALADLGRLDAAIARCQQGLALAEARGDRRLAEVLRERLASYRVDLNKQRPR